MLAVLGFDHRVQVLAVDVSDPLAATLEDELVDQVPAEGAPVILEPGVPGEQVVDRGGPVAAVRSEADRRPVGQIRGLCDAAHAGGCARDSPRRREVDQCRQLQLLPEQRQRRRPDGLDQRIQDAYGFGIGCGQKRDRPVTGASKQQSGLILGLSDVEANVGIGPERRIRAEGDREDKRGRPRRRNRRDSRVELDGAVTGIERVHAERRVRSRRERRHRREYAFEHTGLPGPIGAHDHDEVRGSGVCGEFEGGQGAYGSHSGEVHPQEVETGYADVAHLRLSTAAAMSASLMRAPWARTVPRPASFTSMSPRMRQGLGPRLVEDGSGCPPPSGP